MLPEYQISIEQRYPPVCSSCLPAVEDEIRNRNHMARTNAFGRWLSQSKGKRKKAALTNDDAAKFDRDIRLWKCRGCLWVMALCMSIAGHSSGLHQSLPCLPFHLISYVVSLFGCRIMPTATFPSRLLPIAAVVLFPAAYSWNPTHAPIKRAKHQGRDLRLQGGTAYIASLFRW
jgi:hypothetical protein